MPLFFIQRALVILSFVGLHTSPARAAATWRPIPPEEFAAERPTVDPTAGAVVLLREITIDNRDLEGAALEYYVRMKVFDQKGIDALLLTQIPYEPDKPLRGLAARVVRPDGSAVEVEKQSIFTRDVIRVGSESRRVKSFSFPALTPGCIIEYQYRIRSDVVLFSMQLTMSDDHPVALARIRLRCLQLPGLGTQMIWSGVPNMKQLGRDKRDFYVYEASDIPTVANEPFSPPDSLIKPWFSFYLTPSDGSATDYWSYVAGDIATAAQEFFRPKKILKDTALRLTTGISGDEAKLQRLYDFCRTEIKNLSHDMSGYTPEQIEELKPNRNPVDTLNHGYGTDLEINILFGALLNTLGAKPCLAYSGDRSRYLFNRNLKLREAVPHIVVAISVGSGWRFYDPGAMYLPCGQLRWMNEATSAIVIEGKFWRLIEIPRSEADYSTTKRTGQFRLDETGALEGDVTLELTGHDGIAAKHEYDDKTEDQRRDAIRDALVARLGQAELSDLVLRNVTDPNQPIQIAFHVKVAGYAELTAGRMFVAPGFFQKGLPASFTASSRTNRVYFPYPYRTVDDVTIHLPAGFKLEEPSAPSPVNVDHLLLYKPRLEYSPRAGRLHFLREYTFEGQMIAPERYADMKQSFDRVDKGDAHLLAMHRENKPAVETTPEASTAPAATQ